MPLPPSSPLLLRRRAPSLRPKGAPRQQISCLSRLKARIADWKALHPDLPLPITPSPTKVEVRSILLSSPSSPESLRRNCQGWATSDIRLLCPWSKRGVYQALLELIAGGMVRLSGSRQIPGKTPADPMGRYEYLYSAVLPCPEFSPFTEPLPSKGATVYGVSAGLGIFQRQLLSLLLVKEKEIPVSEGKSISWLTEEVNKRRDQNFPLNPETIRVALRRLRQRNLVIAERHKEATTPGKSGPSRIYYVPTSEWVGVVSRYLRLRSLPPPGVFPEK
jgi:DNA-binding PadR family transcriptional regulator